MEEKLTSTWISAKLVLLIAIAAAFLSVLFSLIYSPGAGGPEKLRVIPLDGAVGPESIVFGPGGDGPFTGVSDGRILKWQGEERGWMQYASVSSPELRETCKGSSDPQREHLCGRPLGLQFGKEGELYVADAYQGLMVVAAGEKFATPVVVEAQGLPLRFTNSLDIDDRTGVVYFTDSSKRFQRREFMAAVLSGDRTGRLMSFDPNTNEVQVLLSGLSFPNGVAVSEDGTFLLLAETTTCKILRYWLQPPAAAGGERLEVIAELPGFPDNISRSPRRGFWVALHSKKGWLASLALSAPWLQRLLLGSRLNLERLTSVLDKLSGAARAVRLSEVGEVLEVLERFGAGKVRLISEVEERNGTLWVGSVVMPFVGIYKL